MSILTRVGVFLRKLRLECDERQIDMAAKLGVTAVYLAYIEKGQRKLPESWFEKIRDAYKLSPEQQKEFRQAMLESSDVLELNVSDASPPKRKLAVKFVSEFAELDEEKVRGLQEILDRPSLNKENG